MLDLVELGCFGMCVGIPYDLRDAFAILWRKLESTTAAARGTDPTHINISSELRLGLCSAQRFRYDTGICISRLGGNI